jgi:2-keto-4-pentenoate hydratase/2-oxohepta-3-ene-1,7-dioic acid hydratase in catechol pathway
VPFTLWPATVAAPGAIVAPPNGTLRFDYEGECAVYVKRGGRNLDTVALWGYTAFNDLGVRDPFLKLAKEAAWGPFSLNLGKNFDTSNSAGPWVAVDEGHDVTRLRCVLTVNGETRQDWTMAEMIYGFDETLSFLSRSLTLRPGDMLSSGTGAGVALESGVDGADWLKPGDVMEVRLDGVAPLRNTVGAW